MDNALKDWLKEHVIIAAVNDDGELEVAEPATEETPATDEAPAESEADDTATVESAAIDTATEETPAEAPVTTDEGAGESAVGETAAYFRVNGDLFKEAVKPLVRFYSAHKVKQEIVHFVARGGKVIASAGTIGDFAVNAFIDTPFGLESEGEFSLTAQQAGTLCRVAKGEDRLTFRADLTNGTINIDNGDWEMQFDARYQWRHIPTPAPKNAATVTFSQANFLHLINKTLYAASKGKTRPIFQAANLKVKGDKAVMVCTDTLRLAVAGCSAESNQDCEANLDCALLNFVKPFLRATEKAKVTLETTARYCVLSFNGHRVLWRNTEGDFPPVDKILSAPAVVIAEVNRDELIKVVSFCLPAADEYNAVKLTFAGDYIVVESKNEEVGRVKWAANAEITSDKFIAAVLAVSANFLLDALQLATSSQIALCLTAENLRIWEANTAAVICPVRGAYDIRDTSGIDFLEGTSDGITIEVESVA